MNWKTLTLATALGFTAAPLATVANEYDKDKDKDKGAFEETGDYISDAALTTKVKSALIAEDDLSGMDIDVDSNDGVVTLSGVVDSGAQVELAEKTVEDLDGVKSVDNKLESPE